VTLICFCIEKCVFVVDFCRKFCTLLPFYDTFLATHCNSLGPHCTKSAESYSIRTVQQEYLKMHLQYTMSH